MRVITGAARGRRLSTVEGLDVRPTAERVKEAVFSAVQLEIEGARMLDLFCGSGQMGIEGLSRGAASCVFVDNGRRSCETARKNLNTVGFMDRARLFQTDALAFLEASGDTFDFVFLDPPYSQGLAERALPLLVPRMSPAGAIFAEHDSRDPLPEECGGFVRVKQYRYGRVSVSAYRKKSG